jgi:hypothetical protein
MRYRITQQLILILIFSCVCQSAFALLFERRPRLDNEISYFIYPIAGNIPKVQEFYGVGATVSGVGGSETDLTFLKLAGEAEHFEGKDFDMNLVLLKDIPLYQEYLTLSHYYLDINNFGAAQGQRGINSDPDKFRFVLANKIEINYTELSLNFYDYQLEFYYALASAHIRPYGLIDENEQFTKLNDAEMDSGGKPVGARFGIIIDDTDHRRDPQIGYRFQWERYTLPATSPDTSAFYQDDFNSTGFIPLTRDKILVLNHFFSQANVTQAGTVDTNQYQCSNSECNQSVLDELYQQRQTDAQQGKATALGGTNRLRGCRSFRFYDTYTNFFGAELRWYTMQGVTPFNWVVMKDVFTSLQFAFFYELGTVSPDASSLFDNFRDSYGVGARAVLRSLIIRTDIGCSDEGSEFTFFVGYPF